MQVRYFRCPDLIITKLKSVFYKVQNDSLNMCNVCMNRVMIIIILNYLLTSDSFSVHVHSKVPALLIRKEVRRT